MSGRPITFTGLRFPEAPAGSNFRGQAFYLGPDRVREALFTTLYKPGNAIIRRSLLAIVVRKAMRLVTSRVQEV